MKTNYSKWAKVLTLVGFSLGIFQTTAEAQQNWQTQKTLISPPEMEEKIKDVCMPIDPVNARDGHTCYIVQRQCWMDNSGYGPCATKNCRFAAALSGSSVNAQPIYPFQYNWYCEPTWDPNGILAPGPAIVPPPECSILGEAWRHRISSDPACAPR